MKETSHADGSEVGRTDYEYDTWSRLKSETRFFAANLPKFQLIYDYNVAGQLTSVTDPFGTAVSYQYDWAGELLSVGNSTYASGIKYRAWGDVKEMTYGNASR